MSSRINHQPIFLLTTQAWRENSLRVEVFSRDFGRVSLLARSARTRSSELRGVLVPFVPLSASWFGKDSLKTLHHVQWLGGWAQPYGQELFSSLYINELILKLTAQEDPHPTLFHTLHDTLKHISMHNKPSTIVLRHFEWQLLRELGIAPDWQRDISGDAVLPENFYWVCPESPVQAVPPHTRVATGVVISGELLQQLGSGSLNTQSDLILARQLTRSLLDFRLPEGIQSRRVLQQLQQLKQKITA